MSERNLRQTDILHRIEPFCAEYGIKMNKSDISQYLSGKAEPGSEKLALLSMALNVSAAWLVGFDVAMADSYPVKIVQCYNQLNDIGKHEAEKRVEELSYVPQYAWDPDFTKLTPEERSRLEEAENGEYIDSENIDWDN